MSLDRLIMSRAGPLTSGGDTIDSRWLVGEVAMCSKPSPSEMALRGRIGAYVQHSRHNPKDTTAAARATFLARFLDEVDPDRALPDEERERRAEAARKAYFAGLSLKSAQARRARKQAGSDDPEL